MFEPYLGKFVLTHSKTDLNEWSWNLTIPTQIPTQLFQLKRFPTITFSPFYVLHQMYSLGFDKTVLGNIESNNYVDI